MNDLAHREGRYEVKFTAPADALGWVEARLRSHPAVFSVSYPPRRVNSLYLDSFDLHAYRDNLAGISQRRKLRLRWYGDDLSPESAQLEVKLRRNRLGWKRRHPLEGLPAFERSGWREIIDCVRAQLPDSFRLHLDAAPQPTLINRYLRRYYASADSAVRVTVDSEPSAFDQRLYARPNLRLKSNLPEVLVVEAKFSADDLKVGRRAVESLRFRASRNSKYAIGISSNL